MVVRHLNVRVRVDIVYSALYFDAALQDRGCGYGWWQLAAAAARGRSDGRMVRVQFRGQSSVSQP